MSEVQNTQPVVETTNVQPAAVTEAVDARNTGDDLDTLLTQFDQQTKPAADSKPEPKPGADPDLKQTLAEVKSFVSEAQNIQFKRDMSETVKVVRGDLDPEIFDDGLVEAWMDAQARQDPRLAQAWVQRNANPKQFEQVKVALGKNFAKKFSKLPDKQVTEDREAVTAAVRGASSRAPEGKAPEFAKMSTSDFQKEKDKLFGT